MIAKPYNHTQSYPSDIRVHAAEEIGTKPPGKCIISRKTCITVVTYTKEQPIPNPQFPSAT